MPGGPGGFTPEQLHRFRAPALVVAAEHDCFWSGKAIVAGAERSLPGSRVVMLPRARHLPARRHLDDTNRRLLEFFDEVVSGKAGPRAVPASPTPTAAEE